MNALKQRWQSGCLAKVLIVGGALVLLVWWILVCWFLVLFAQGLSKSPVGEVRATGVVTPMALERATAPPGKETTSVTPEPTDMPAATAATRPTETPLVPGYDLAYELGTAWANLMVAYRNRIMLFIVLISVAWLLNRWRSKRERK